MNRITCWIAGLGAAAVAASCLPMGPVHINRYSPEQVVVHGERQLAITGAVAQTIYDDFDEYDRALRMQIHINGETVIDGEYEPWLGSMVVDGDYQGVPVAAHCVERLPYDWVADVYCRVYVDGQKTVLLSMVFGREDYPIRSSGPL